MVACKKHFIVMADFYNINILCSVLVNLLS